MSLDEFNNLVEQLQTLKVQKTSLEWEIACLPRLVIEREPADNLLIAFESPDVTQSEKLELAQFYEQHCPKEIVADLKTLLISKYQKQLRKIAKSGADSEDLGAALPHDPNTLNRVMQQMLRLQTIYMSAKINQGYAHSIKFSVFRFGVFDLVRQLAIALHNQIKTFQQPHAWNLRTVTELERDLAISKKSYKELEPAAKIAARNAVNLYRVSEPSTIEKDLIFIERVCRLVGQLEQKKAVAAPQTAAQNSAAQLDPATCDILQDITIPQLLLLVQLGIAVPYESELTEPVYTDLLRSLKPYPKLKQRVKKNLASNLMVSTLNAPREVTQIIAAYLDRIPGNKKKKLRTAHTETGCVIA